MNNLLKHQKGLTLVELMIGLTTGLILLGGVTMIYISTIVSSSHTLKQSKLNQEMTTLMNVISSDIRRAGIWGSPDFLSPQSNPFAQVNDTALEVINNMTDDAQQAATGSGTCIVYAYDSDDTDGTAVVNADVVGFRHHTTNNTVQMRETGNASAHDSCSDASGTWLDVTDNNVVEITTLNFSLANSTCLNTREPNGINDDGDAATDDTAEMDCYTLAPASGDASVEMRTVDITMTGRLTNDNAVTYTMTQTVRVRNDLVRVH